MLVCGYLYLYFLYFYPRIIYIYAHSKVLADSECEYLLIIRLIGNRKEAVRIIIGCHFNRLHFI